MLESCLTHAVQYKPLIKAVSVSVTSDRHAVISPIHEEKNEERMPLLFPHSTGISMSKIRNPAAAVENDVNVVKDVKESYKKIPIPLKNFKRLDLDLLVSFQPMLQSES